MFNWNDQEQVGVQLWNKHKINEDHILPRPTKEGNTLLTFGECRKKQRYEYATNIMRSTVETSRAKHDFLDCKVEKRFGCSSQDCNGSNLQMDEWSDLPYLSSVLNDGFNDESDQDSAVTELMNNLADASNLYSGVGIMTRYNNSSELFPNKGLSSLSKPCSLPNGDAMQLDGEPEPFGHDDKENDSFLDYDWANIEDLDDLDKIFKNNYSFDVNEKIHNAVDITSNTSRFIPVPGVPTSMEHTSDIGSPYHQLGEHSDANVNSFFSKKADWKNQTWRAPEAEKGKGISFQDLNCSYSSEKQPVSSCKMQDSNVNPLHIIQFPPLGQVSFSHGVMFSDFECSTPLPQICVESNLHKPINGGFIANLNHSNNHKISNKAEAAVSKAVDMTPSEKIEKLKRRQKMQAILAIQKQCEQYGHQIYSTDDSVSQECLSKNQTQNATTSIDTMEECKQKQSTPEVSYLEEQYQSQLMSSSSINGQYVEEAIYHQLQYTMQKLDERVRLNIRDSLFRLARSAMERLNASDRSCTDKNKDEESNNHDRSSSTPDSERVTNPIDRTYFLCTEKNKDEYGISMDEESNNHDRSSSMSDSERITNPIDRIVAHLLFHKSSGSYSLPIGDGNVAMETSMCSW